MTTTARPSRRQMIGVVTSAKSDKTITVEIQRTFKHKKYGKYLRRRERYLTHDEQRSAREGDVVCIESTRPLSRNKRWRLVQVVTRSQLAGTGAPEFADPAAEVLASIGAAQQPAAGTEPEKERS